MGGFFSLDGPFYKFGSILADVMILSLLWLVLSLPIFTIGASTTAVYYVTTKRVSNRDGYLWSSFWHSFKANFVKSTLVFLTLVLVFGILYINIKNINVVGSWRNIILPLQLCFFIEMVFISLYVFPLIARFDMKFTQIFRTAFFMANRHLLTTISTLIVLLAVLFITYVYPIFFMLAAGIYCFATSYLLIKIFKKYRPDLDPDIDMHELRPLNLGDDDELVLEDSGELNLDDLIAKENSINNEEYSNNN